MGARLALDSLLGSLSSCQPASVCTGPPSFLGSLVGVRLLAFSGPEPSSGLVSGAWGFRCVRVSRSHGSEARRLLCATSLLAGPACVWHCRLPGRTSHQPVLGRAGSPMRTLAIEASSCRPPSACDTPPSLQASLHPPGLVTHSWGNTLVFLSGAPRPHAACPARWPSVLSQGHITHDIVDVLIQLIFTFAHGSTLCHTSCVSVGKNVCVDFCGVSNSISGGVNRKHC